MGIPANVYKQLPKANVITVRWWSTSLWTSFRLSNAWQIHIGHIIVIIRATWLECSARSNFPHLFEEAE